MSHVRRFDHVGLTVADLDVVTAFFVTLGLEVEGRTFVEGEFLDTVIGIPDSRSEIVMLRPPDGGAGLELSSFARPEPPAHLAVLDVLGRPLVPGGPVGGVHRARVGGLGRGRPRRRGVTRRRDVRAAGEATIRFRSGREIVVRDYMAGTTGTSIVSFTVCSAVRSTVVCMAATKATRDPRSRPL